jgi:hypothetical protein
MTEQTVRVTQETVEVLREELDWATLREAMQLAATAALRFAGWWLCGRGFHAWELWEYEDGTVVEECGSCRVVRAAPAVAA